MKTNKAFAVLILLAGFLFTSAGTARSFAQDVPEPPQDQSQDQTPAQDPPGRVARLDYSNGSVSMQPNGQGDWVEAVTNRPLTAGDNIWADKDSRAELEIGSTALRMDSETSITFLDLDDHTTQIKLSLGSMIVRVRHLDDGDTFEIDTPNLAFNIQMPGEYRFDVNSDGNLTDVSVSQGRGAATGGGESYMVVAGQQARFSGTDQLDHEIAQLPGNDDFDNWSADRDQREDHSQSANYVSDEMTGYEDLDEYGSWSYQASYGPCWTPTGVAVDWAPYRMGHWAWIAPWGWTWVDDEPWGFAPFHYGRWAFISSRWYWVPGRVYVRPVYAPALVAWVGGAGFHIGVSVGGPGVGWFPLAPGEVFMPWYRTSRVYVNNVNITNTRVNITQVTNVYNVYNSRTNVTHITYVNQRLGNAVTVVNHDTFVNARPVARNFVRVDARTVASAQVNFRPDEQPGRASAAGAGAPARYRPPSAVINRQVVATRMPPARATFGQSHPVANIRTEPAGEPQAAGRGQYVPQPNTHGQNAQQGTPRYEAQRPSQPSPTPTPRTTYNNNNNNVPRPGNNMGQTRTGAPGANPPQMNARPMERPQQTEQQNDRWGVRTAPPVQNRPETQQNEQRKFDAWQQQRQRSAPAPRSSGRESAPRSEPHSSPPSHESHHR